ncbi:sensor histidine kinase [Paenibacillus lentus]|uniref:histidine kinase n=1 Tax=Paenibacillus lentus TaxID=1338368 RepID=A0A3S8RQR2_9BACL|nr:sensor histidine kinase [Paenibacillus lentus]AZK45294.1 HAMP domain-containing protein [Paenibacillus lentus]
MKTGISIFKKLMLGVLLMFSLIIIIFWVIYRLNINDIQTELKKNKISEVKFITLQLTNQFEQVLMNTITLSEDQSVRKYPYELEYGNLYSRHETKLMIIDKLSLNSTYTPWNNSITLYYPDFEETISSDPAYNIDKYNPPTQTLNKWTLHLEKDGSGYYSNLTQSHIGPLLIETRVSLDQLRKMIRQYTSGTPLLYDSYNNKTIQSEPALLSEDIINRITPLITGESGFLSLEVDGIEHIVTYMKSDMLDLYFIDYHPKHQFIKPIYRNNTLFISAIVVLLLISLIYSLVLRKQVRTPIIHLRKAISLFDRGDFSSRVSSLDAEEFRMLGNSFNRMAENTQKLIEQVLVGELELKEARLKQFQAQINPHFLYNCLNFIQSKAGIEDYDSVTAMTLHLSAYYRYVHKIEHIDSTIREELRFVENYLSIIQLRKSTLTFSIEIPTEIGTHSLPRMILQPLVENCVQHGIENSLGPGHIEIRARNDETSIQISIKDNGAGMSADKLSLIRQRMEESKELEDISGIGIRNVYQRLKLYFGPQAGLSITSSLSEGTCYTLTIQKQEEDYAAAAIS